MEKLKYDAEDIKNILLEVRVCAKIHCTKNGKVYSTQAEGFLERLDQYTEFCIPEEVDNWKKITRELIYNPICLKPGVECNDELQKLIDSRDSAIIDGLYNFMDAGAIMEKYFKTKSWEDVKELIESQCHSGWTFTGMSNIILQFFPWGIEFVDYFDPTRIERDDKFKKIYTDIKEKRERAVLTQRLVNVLTYELKIKKQP